MQRHLVTLVVCGVLAGAATDASAQSGSAWTDRAYFNLNWAVEAGSSDVTGVHEQADSFGEVGRIEATSPADAGSMIDVGAGVRVWRNVSIGLAFHRVGSTSDARVNGTVPHPLFFNRPRTLDTTVPGLRRKEHAVHLQFGYMWPVNDKLDVLVYAGPSFFRLSQDVVTGVTVGETEYPFDTIVSDETVQRQRDSAVGGHIGADVTYKLYTWKGLDFGGGMFLRYAGATAKLRVLDTEVKSDVGGAQFGLGLRVRY